MKCECGGTLKPTRLKSFDFTPMAGIHCELKKVPGLQCESCGYITIPGGVINRTLEVLALLAAQTESRLTKELAVFLRKRLRLTQQALASRMGTSRETVAKWECGMSEISATYDGLLRMFVLSHFAGPELAKEVMSALASLNHVRTEPPQALPPFVLEKELEGLRAA